MGLKNITVQDAEYDGQALLLLHGEDVSEAFWNRTNENVMASYNAPFQILSGSITTGGDVVDFYGCIPPANPASVLTEYEEKYEVLYHINYEHSGASGYGTFYLYGGTNLSSLSLIGTRLTDRNGTGSFAGTYLTGTSEYYSVSTGSANPYYLQARCVASAGVEYGVEFGFYYRKYTDIILPYSGTATDSFSSGTAGVLSGTDGSGSAISDSYSGTNIDRWELGTGTYPYTGTYVQFGASTGTAALYSSYYGDTSPHATYEYTRFSSSLRFHVGTDNGTMTSKMYSFLADGSGTHNASFSVYNFDGTTYGKISSAALACGTDGTTFALGSWIGGGTAGFLHTTISGLHDDGTTKSMTWGFSLSAFGEADRTVTVDVNDHDAYFDKCYSIQYQTPSSVRSSIGVLLQNGAWGL